MVITVKTITGTVVELADLNPSATGLDSKERLKEAEGIHVENQMLFFKNNVIEDDSKLLDYQVTNSATLYLAVKVGKPEQRKKCEADQQSNTPGMALDLAQVSATNLANMDWKTFFKVVGDVVHLWIQVMGGLFQKIMVSVEFVIQKVKEEGEKAFCGVERAWKGLLEATKPVVDKGMEGAKYAAQEGMKGAKHATQEGMEGAKHAATHCQDAAKGAGEAMKDTADSCRKFVDSYFNR